MSIVPTSVVRELESLRNRLDQLFTETTGSEQLLVPVDVQETDEAVTVTASVPGVKPEDLTVEVNQGVLTIRGESREEREEERGTWHLQERRVGRIQRTITLPAPVKEDQAEARVENGVLHVRLPKAEVGAKKRITVKAS